MTDLFALANEIRSSKSETTEYAQRIDRFCRSARLDDAVLAHARELISGGRPVGIHRNPVRLGMGSIWLSEITLRTSDGGQLTLMEKAVEAAGSEAQFWKSVKSSDLQLVGQSYTSVAPLFSIAAGPVVVLYSPYIDEVHKSRRSSKENFRSHIDVLVRATAEFNGANFVGSAHRSSTQRRIRLSRKKAPSIEKIQSELGLKSVHVSRLLQQACEDIDSRWDELHEMYDSVPACLCHNDIGPGNAIVYEDHVHLLDFEKAALAPVGSDMHTVLRWGGDSLTDEHEAERLLTLYTDEIKKLRPDVTLDQVRVGAWVTFFMRYSAIAKWSSARNLDSFSLALLKARELLTAAT